MRYLGIDYGTKRVGLALSDEGGVMAFPHSVLGNTPALLADIGEVIKKEGVGSVVFGLSRTLEGGENAVMEGARACARALEEVHHIPIYFESEVYSTQEALREQGRTPLTDASAAAIILNSYLSRIQQP